jgi:signal transduction histidine kinase
MSMLKPVVTWIRRLRSAWRAVVAGATDILSQGRLPAAALVLNRTLVYGVLTAAVLGVYTIVVGALGILFEAESGNLAIALLATGLVAFMFQPLRSRLQRGVNRLMYGERDDPYAVLSRLGERLEATLAPEAVLPAIVESVAHALKLPYVAITLKQGEDYVLAAAYGVSVGEALSLPLVYQGATIGQVLVGRRANDEDFSAADWHLLHGIARQAGVAAHDVRLTADLQRSREQLVTAREEERRRLQRDLHDGLGPNLASLTLKLDAALNLMARDPNATAALLLELKAQTQATVADIRRLVYDLRPLALDHVGLVSAIRGYATSQNNLNGLSVSIEAPEAFPPLPAAVEVVAYRIVQEALTNVARHAQAQTCTVRFETDDELCVEIRDDGVGLPRDHRLGVGLTSMRERAAELGGQCGVESITPRGTRVWARLPLKSPAFPFARGTGQNG